MITKRPVIAFLTGSSANWGGASRVLYTTLLSMDLTRMEPLVMLSGSGPIRVELEACGIRCLAWGPPTEPVHKLSYIKALFQALRLFHHEHVAALHVNSRFWRPAEVLAALLLRIPVLVHFHVVNREEGSFMDRCQAAICVSRYVAAESVPITLRKEVIYNPVQLTRFEAGENLRSEWSIPLDAIVIAFVGQIREIKGVQDFIAMARRIPNPDARFLIAGECRDPKKYSGSYSEQNLQDLIGDDPRIRYIGYVKEVENVYHSADIVVVPSRWQEPLGLINLEAAACRKPVVATKVGGIPEVVEDGLNGYLVEAGDVEALSERVSRLIADPDLRRCMGEAGRKRVEQDFTSRPVREFETLLLSHARR